MEHINLFPWCYQDSHMWMQFLFFVVVVDTPHQKKKKTKKRNISLQPIKV